MDNPVVCPSGLKLLDPFSIHFSIVAEAGSMYVHTGMKIINLVSGPFFCRVQ